MSDTSPKDYILDEQIGFILRQVFQRHSNIFAGKMDDDNLTPTQFATMAKLLEVGSCSQNKLGRLVAMDAATIKGVVDRLIKRGLTKTSHDPSDARRLNVELTGPGRFLAKKAITSATRITDKTLEPLDADERDVLLNLLKKLC